MKYILLFFLCDFFVIGLCGQVEKISYRSYPACYKLYNDSVDVIISPESGGRLLKYSLNGKNIIFESSALNGKMLSSYLSSWFDPDGGRFDIGPEDVTSNIHDTLWMGKFSAQITGNYSLLITSPLDKQTGVIIKREFTLDSSSSYLNIHQTMINVSSKQKSYYFWSRTLVPINGKMVVPLKETSSYPLKWGKYYSNPWRFVYDNPQDVLISVNDSLLAFKANITNNSGKYGVDSDDGWMLYGLNEMLFVKRFAYSADGNYKEPASQTIVLYTNGSKFVEMEPMGPEMILEPGDSASFDEDWWLLSYKPAIDKNFNMVDAASYIKKAANYPGSSSVNTETIKYVKNPNNIFSILSNPVQIQAEFKIQADAASRCNAFIYNSTGRQIRVVPVTESDFYAGRCNLSVQDLNNGFYLCKFQMDGHSESVGFVVQR